METSKYLFQKTKYRALDGDWHDNYFDALKDTSEKITFDISTILSMTSFTYPVGVGTLVNEIKRQPWMSNIDNMGIYKLEEIPKHDTLFKGPKEIADNLIIRIRKEIIRACENKKNIYIMLSGGLDSRIIAAITEEAKRSGEIDGKLKAISYGMKNSRDVFYGKCVADVLGIDWIHVELSSLDVLDNINIAAEKLGCLTSGIHLHKFDWLKNIPQDSLVLAGTFGDTIGRGEPGSKHILELNYLKPIDKYGLIKPQLIESAKRKIDTDLNELYKRSNTNVKYIHWEHQEYAYRLRNLAHAQSIVNNYCEIYQVFTAPEVFAYMWSLHPSIRNNKIYGEVLEILNPKLARLPWARNNRALYGKTVGADSKLQVNYYNYERWISVDLFDELNKRLDINWFNEINIFDINNIKQLIRKVESSKNVYIQEHDIFLWLVGFRHFANKIEETGKTFNFDSNSIINSNVKIYPSVKNKDIHSRKWYKKSNIFILLSSIKRKYRRQILIRDALKKYPLK